MDLLRSAASVWAKHGECEQNMKFLTMISKLIANDLTQHASNIAAERKARELERQAAENL